MPLVTVYRYSREEIRANRDKFYVFGDNMRRVGFGGQAYSARGEPNAIGIPTLWEPHRPFKDMAFPSVKDEIDAGFDRVTELLKAGVTVVWPEDGIGSGLARLEESAPAIWNYIVMRYNFLVDLSDDLEDGGEQSEEH